MLDEQNTDPAEATRPVTDQASQPAPDERPERDRPDQHGRDDAAAAEPPPGAGTPDAASAEGTSAVETPPPPPARKRSPRKSAAKKAAPSAAPADTQDASPLEGTAADGTAAEPNAADGTAAEKDAAVEAPAKRPAAKRTRKTTAKKSAPSASAEPGAAAEPNAEGIAPGPTTVEDGTASKAPSRSTRRSRARASTAAPEPAHVDSHAAAQEAGATGRAEEPPAPGSTAEPPAAEAAAPEADGTGGASAATAPVFQAPEPAGVQRRRTEGTAERAEDRDARLEGEPSGRDHDEESAAKAGAADRADREDRSTQEPEGTAPAAAGKAEDEGREEGEGGRRRRRRGGRRRRKGGSGADSDAETPADEAAGDSGTAAPVEVHEDEHVAPEGQDEGEGGEGTSSRRRRRRRRNGEGNGEASDDSESAGTRGRKSRSSEDEITGFTGSTRLEAKKQRRREGREAGRRRAPIISEAEFLARRESVDRKMVIRQRGDLTQIAVLEDKVLVEHYVARESQTSLIGNVYLGRVQNVLPSMEAAFIDIGKGRNAVLYAGEVNWDALGAKDGSQRKIEQVLKPGQPVLVQVTKDPVGHKGARLTSQVSLPGRFLVYVPDGTTSGISRKLPENERNRLKTLLKEIVPDSAGVIVRTAAEGASEDELTHDVERLTARWADISAKVAAGSAPQLLYGEPDLTVKVVRDLFTEDFGTLVISGDEAWDLVHGYVEQVAPDLLDRVRRHDDSEKDAFAEYRIDEQIAKALDRKVWLPSGGSLVIDRTEAMTVVDVNTGKFTGSGGNLEETVTKNNLEAAEEIVRQLRLRDIGGIIVVDFIDMVLESNRELVLRRLIECLGRDRTRHQVAEVTSLGLVQMTRKRIGTGLLEAFSETCEQCQGRGVLLHAEPVEARRAPAAEDTNRRRGRRGKSDDHGDGGTGDRGSGSAKGKPPESVRPPTPAQFAAMVRHEPRVETPEDSEVGSADLVVDTAGAEDLAVDTAGAEDLVVDTAGAEDLAVDTAGAEDLAFDTAGVEDRGVGTAAADPPVDAAAVVEPLVEETAAERPSTEEQTAEQPAAEQPAADQPAADQPAAEQPAADQPAAQEPAGPPPGPRLVTVRRTRVSRPAGPPATAASAATTAVAEPHTAAVSPPERRDIDGTTEDRSAD